MKRLLLVVAFVLGAACATHAQQTVNVTASDPTTNARTQVGDSIAKAFRQVLVDATGSPFGTAGNPVRTNPTGTTAQPVTQTTGSNLHMVCDSGCSSSTAPADASTFTAGTTSQSPVGGFFQTTATNNPLTNGQMGAFQATAQRAMFVNFRNASGTEIGTSSNPVTATANQGTAAAQANRWPVCFSDGSNCLSPDTQGQHDSAIGTVTNVTGGYQFYRASAAPCAAVSADDDAVLPCADRKGALWMNQAPTTPVTKLALSTTVQTVIGSAATLMWVNCGNKDTTAANFAYVQLFDVSGTVTLGTTAPTLAFFVPANSPGGQTPINASFANAVKVAATTSASGSTAPATAIDCNFGYR